LEKFHFGMAFLLWRGGRVNSCEDEGLVTTQKLVGNSAGANGRTGIGHDKI